MIGKDPFIRKFRFSCFKKFRLVLQTKNETIPPKALTTAHFDLATPHKDLAVDTTVLVYLNVDVDLSSIIQSIDCE